jgi:hypothetical protein
MNWEEIIFILPIFPTRQTKRKNRRARGPKQGINFEAGRVFVGGPVAGNKLCLINSNYDGAPFRSALAERFCLESPWVY